MQMQIVLKPTNVLTMETSIQMPSCVRMSEQNKNHAILEPVHVSLQPQMPYYVPYHKLQ